MLRPFAHFFPTNIRLLVPTSTPALFDFSYALLYASKDICTSGRERCGRSCVVCCEGQRVRRSGKAENERFQDGSDSKDSESAYGNAEDMAWHTWIDYPKWTELVNAYHASGGKNVFKLDYVARTPDWALFGAEEQGFSPYEVHFKRSKSGRTVTGEKQGSASAIAKMTSVLPNALQVARRATPAVWLWMVLLE